MRKYEPNSRIRSAKCLESRLKERLQRSVNNAEKAIDKLQEEFDVRVPVGITEELDERMKAERELLGAYVTAHL